MFLCTLRLNISTKDIYFILEHHGVDDRVGTMIYDVSTLLLRPFTDIDVCECEHGLRVRDLNIRNKISKVTATT